MPPSGADKWRARFVLSAKAQEPKVSLVGHGTPHSAAVVDMAADASAALAAGTTPELVDDGLGGTYFISKRLPGGRETKICVFKPRDEEPNAVNNPKQQQQQQQAVAVGAPGLKGGIRVGDAALNEWAGVCPSPSVRIRSTASSAARGAEVGRGVRGCNWALLCCAARALVLTFLPASARFPL